MLVQGPSFLAFCARQMASRQMDQWAFSEAGQWLAKAAWLAPKDGRTDVMQAACFRQLDQMDRWSEAIQSAERKGAPATQVQVEVKLGLIRSGQISEEDERRLEELVEAGASLHDVMAVFVHGYLAQGELGKAKLLLDNWRAAHPDVAHVAYMRGVYLCRLDESVRALAELNDALAKQPRHEPARQIAAQVCEGGDWLDQALDHYSKLSVQTDGEAAATVNLARVLRKLGRIDDARSVLGSLAERSSEAVTEMARIEFESGNYEKAGRWLAQTNRDSLKDHDTSSAVATALFFSGQTTHAERLFAGHAAATSKSARRQDLEAKLAVDPSDKQAADELLNLAAVSAASSYGAEGIAAGRSWQDELHTGNASGAELYAQHCSVCHGPEGAGDGRAAWHLFPKPRDFRTERFRLVSTRNGVPTLDDLQAVTRNGMPGASMPPFEDLSESQHRLLALEVLRLHREGTRVQFVRMLESEGEEIDEDEIHQLVESRTTPGELVTSPQIGPPDPDAIARGREIYSQLGCSKCHGDDGTGATGLPLFDDNGRPTRSRNLADEPFKGGQEPESIYLRIALGMPGTPHPASWAVPEDQLVDLVHFCRSLSREPKRVLTNHQQAILASSPACIPKPR
jgi:mono/diheme cytochrome c family protein/Tfp pilus assembly protein PilF